MQPIHRVNRQHDDGVLFQLLLVANSHQFQLPATFDHLTNQLVCIVSIFSCPLRHGSAQIGPVFLKKFRCRFRPARLGNLGKQFFQILIESYFARYRVLLLPIIVMFPQSLFDSAYWINLSSAT